MNLDMYIELVKNDIISSLKKTGKLNLTKEESIAFHELLHDGNVVIRPADKGPGIVVLDRDKYITSLEDEMKHGQAYSEADHDLTKQSFKKVKKLVHEMEKKGDISKDLASFLIPKYPKPGKLKGNPKIHKKDVPMRTIVSGVDTATEKIAELAEYELRHFVEESPSYIRDTTDFINKLKQEVPAGASDNCILFCFDVCKLYPSIPRHEGIEACREALSQRPSPLIKSTEAAIDVIKTVLDNNNFSLGRDKHFIQTEGVAIGSRLGKNFACTYMRKWDEQLLEHHIKPAFYKRFIDDGFGLWPGTEEELKEFADHANSIHPSIKVELRYSKTRIEFLDTWVILEDGNVYTDLYKKPTDKQLYLRNDSNHPPCVKKGLAYGLALRIRRICEKEADYVKHRAELKRQLRTRGYSGKVIETQLRKVDGIKREDLLTQTRTRKRNNGRVPLVVTYSNMLPNLHHILGKYMPVLHESDRMSQIFERPPLVAYRRDRNLCDTLVHGKTNRILIGEHIECQDGCDTCAKLLRRSVADTDNQTTYETATNFNCKSQNVIYGIVCSKCDSTVYVGETERELRERISEHIRDITRKADKPIMRHFDGSHLPDNARFTVLERLYGASRVERQIREAVWIKKLRTMRPHGCNVKDCWVPASLRF